MTLLSKKLLTRLKITFLIGITLLSSTHALAQSIVTQWNDVAIQAVRDTGFAPTKTARALAILNTCMYDAWATYDSQAKRTQLNISRITNSSNVGQSQTEAMSYAAYECLVDLFPGKDLTAYVDPTQDSDFYDLLTTLVNTAKYSHGVSTPAGVGHAAASAVLGYRSDDGSNQHGNVFKQCEPREQVTTPYSDYTCYTPQNAPLHLDAKYDQSILIAPDHWQPLIVGSNAQSFLTPQWRLVTPYALSSGDQLRNTLEGPAPYSSEAYEKQAQEILNFSLNLNDQRKAIVEYWMNGPKSETPPGHWVLFAKFISDRDGNDLNKDIKMYFALTNAMLDASIAAWDAKFAFDYVRPISAIRFLFNGLTIHYWNGTTDAGNWMPYQTSNVVTPAFPEYVSGHSTFSFAAAETLKLFTGSDKFDNEVTIPAGSSSVELHKVPSNDIKLHWNTFTAAATEAGISRRYGGIHFKDGDLQGRKLGKAIADIAWKKSLSYFNGSDGESKTRSGKE